MQHTNQNFSIVVNWRAKGFGCAKNCSYCSWRNSPLLPHGPQATEDISAFIRQCRKSFITISGGGDPLYRLEENRHHLLAMIDTIRAHGFRVRLITREVQHIASLRGIVDHFSISLDSDVLDQVTRYQSQWAGMDIEYSLVLPPLPTDDLLSLKPQYAALHRRLGARLVLRENLESIHPVDLARLSFGHSGIVFVPKTLCLSSRYLAMADCVGHDLVQDNEGLARYLMNHPDIFLFGGFVRHLVNPKVHTDYGDIDLIALSADVIEELSARFGFTFRQTSPDHAYPRYFLGQSSRAGKSLQLIVMDSASDALRFIRGGTYDADTLGYGQGRFYFSPAVGESATLLAIHSKRIRPLKGERDTSLFHSDRPLIEQRHSMKLLRKGFSILD
jgi:hypothetical protein